MLTKRLSALALLASATLGLAACSSGDPSPSPSPSTPEGPTAAEDAATIAAVVWETGDGGLPALSFDLPLTVGASAARLLTDGDGDPIEPGQIIAIDYVVFTGTDGTVQYSTYEYGAPESLAFNEAELDIALWDVLQGQHVGAQLVFATLDSSAAPVDGVYPAIVIAITVSGTTTVLDRATGEALAPVAGLPVVTVTETGMPNIDFAGVQMPTNLVVQPLIVGAGVPVAEGQTIIAHYKGWLWDGEVFDCSWARGAPATFTFGPGYLIDGWVQGLAGQPVGSQVLLIIPPELGYGDAGQGDIPGGATLVFVVDILAAM